MFGRMLLKKKHQTPANHNYSTLKDVVCIAAVGACLFGAAFLLVTVAKGSTPPPRHHHARVCKNSPLPRALCLLIRSEAPRVKGAKVRWSMSVPLARILRPESGFDWCAVNPGRHACNYTGTSSSCGIAQRLPCNQRVFHSRRLQTRDLLRYIAGRYGSPRKALAFRSSHNWY